jgi:hypothetical protein
MKKLELTELTGRNITMKAPTPYLKSTDHHELGAVVSLIDFSECSGTDRDLAATQICDAVSQKLRRI